MCVMPVVMLANSLRSGDNTIMLLLAGCYIPLIPMTALNLLRYSQHWQAADVFLITPTPGPGRILIGARKAVEIFLVLPAAIILLAASIWIGKEIAPFALLLPGILALPVYARMGILSNHSLPLSQPGEEAKSTNRGLLVMVSMFSALALGGIAAFAKFSGFYKAFLISEAVTTIFCVILMDRRLRNLKWALIDDTSSLPSAPPPLPTPPK
jgi:ABC-2 type transport system permease protein